MCNSCFRLFDTLTILASGTTSSNGVCEFLFGEEFEDNKGSSDSANQKGIVNTMAKRKKKNKMTNNVEQNTTEN